MLVSLIIKAIDLATAPLRSVTSSLAGMATSAGDANTASGALKNAFVQGTIQANLYGAAIAQVQKGIGFFNSKLEEAKSLQLSNTQAATTFASMTGMSYDEGAAFIEKMNQRLAKSAAALPGATQDYKTLATAIQDNVLDAFKSASGVDMSGFENSLAAISESYGALSAASGTPVQNTMLGLTKALGGASTASLRQIQFFEQNQVILNEIDKRLKAMGKSTLADLNVKERVKLIEEVGKKYITEDFKKQAGQSVDGLIQSFNSSLFDPSSGIFGLMRDLDPKTKGVQSAFSAFNEVLIGLVGNNGLVTQINSMFQTLGLTIDPMAIARSALLRFNDMLKGLEAIFESANVQFTAGNFQEGFNILFSKVGEVIFYQVKSVAGAVAGSVVGFLSGDIPQKIAAGLVASLQTQVQAIPDRFMKMSGAEQAATAAIGAIGVFALLNTKLGVVNRMVAGQATAVTMTVGRAIAEISTTTITRTGNTLLWFGSTARLTATNVSTFVAGLPALAGTAWTSISTGATSVTLALRGLTVAGMWSSLTAGLATGGAAVTGFVGSVTAAGTALLFNPITLGIAAIATAALLIYKYWQPITGFISGFVSGVVEGLAPLQPTFTKVGSILAPLGDLIGIAVSWFMALIKPVKDTDGSAKNLGETLGKILGGAILGTVNAIASLVDWIGKAFNAMGDLINRAKQLPIISSFFNTPVSAPVPIAAPAINPVVSAVQAASNLVFGGAKFQGNIPNAANGLDLTGMIQAATRENRAKPPGSQLVVANSSELILTREQVQKTERVLPPVTAGTFITPVSIPPVPQVNAPEPPRVILPTPASPGSKSLSIQIGDIVVHSGTTEPDAIASYVIDRIRTQLATELYGQL